MAVSHARTIVLYRGIDYVLFAPFSTFVDLYGPVFLAKLTRYSFSRGGVMDADGRRDNDDIYPCNGIEYPGRFLSNVGTVKRDILIYKSWIV